MLQCGLECTNDLSWTQRARGSYKNKLKQNRKSKLNYDLNKCLNTGEHRQMLQNSPFHLGDVRLMVGLSNLRVFSNLKDSMILFYDPCFLLAT